MLELAHKTLAASEKKKTELKQKTTVLYQVIVGYPNINVLKNMIQSSTEKVCTDL